MGTLHNHHSHCHYCDGSDPMENYVKKAIESGFQSYGFSSHVPLKIQSDWSLTVEGFKKYIADFQLLKEKFAHQIELYCGLETDFVAFHCSATVLGRLTEFFLKRCCMNPLQSKPELVVPPHK